MPLDAGDREADCGDLFIKRNISDCGRKPVTPIFPACDRWQPVLHGFLRFPVTQTQDSAMAAVVRPPERTTRVGTRKSSVLLSRGGRTGSGVAQGLQHIKEFFKCDEAPSVRQFVIINGIRQFSDFRSARPISVAKLSTFGLWLRWAVVTAATFNESRCGRGAGRMQLCHGLESLNL